MFDLPAMPIAFALTLWDAVPIFLSISLALAVAARALVAGRFQSVWRVRETAGIEGLVYLALFMPSLLPVLATISIAQTLVAWRTAATDEAIPDTPGRAIRVRAEEVIFPVLLGSVAAAYIKVAGPDITGRGLGLELLVAVVAGGLFGYRSGTVAIPAVAIMVHLGGAVPAIACMLAAAARYLIVQRISTVAAAEA